jgi:hypothetical protein
MARDPSSALAEIAIVEATNGVGELPISDCEEVMVFIFVY